MKTIRQQIIEAFLGQLAAWPWQSAPFTGVHAGRLFFDPDDDPLPLITVIPRPDETVATRYGADENTMSLEVSALIRLEQPDGIMAGAVETGEPVKGELQQAALAISPSLAALVERIEYRGGGIDDYPGEPGQTVISVGITLAVVYETAKGDPYNQ